MKKKFYRFLIVLFVFGFLMFMLYQVFGWDWAACHYRAHVEQALSQKTQPASTQRGEEVFSPGEKIVYTLRYMGLPAGKAIVRAEEIKNYNNHLVYSLSGRVRTSEFISLFFEAEGILTSYMDKDRLYSLRFTEESQASGHRKNQKVVTFDQENLFLEVEGEKIKILPNTQDPLSAFYLLRLLDYEKIKDGYKINIKTRKRDRTLFVKFEGREILKTPFGKIPVVKVFLHLEPVKATLRHEISGFVWFTDDEKRIPMLVKLKTKAGPATLLLYDLKL